MNYRDWRDAQIAFLQSKLTEAQHKNRELILENQKLFERYNNSFNDFERMAPGYITAIVVSNKNGQVRYKFGEDSKEKAAEITVLNHPKSVTDDLKVGDEVGFKMLFEKSKKEST